MHILRICKPAGIRELKGSFTAFRMTTLSKGQWKRGILFTLLDWIPYTPIFLNLIAEEESNYFDRTQLIIYISLDSRQ